MSDLEKILKGDSDGMETYEYIVNHCDGCEAEMDQLVEHLRHIDSTGQFLASSARYLSAVDHERYAPWLGSLIEGAIDKDRERRYIGSLLEAIWGSDYMERAESLAEADDNFRRIYKRIYPSGKSL